jgi:hypothetical protein
MRPKLMLVAGIVIGALVLIYLSLTIPGPYSQPTNSTRASVILAPPAPEPGMSQPVTESTTPQAPDDLLVLQSAQRDLYGDGKKENVILYIQNEDNWPRYLRLMVDGDEKVRLRLEDGYTLGDVQFADLDNDGVDDVLLYQDCTGSSGARLLDVYRPSRGPWQRIFAAPYNAGDFNNRYVVKYIGDYQMSFVDQQTWLKSMIKLDRETHQGMEDLLEQSHPWVDPIADYRFTDVDGDGAHEIIAIQRVVGVAHVDTIAELRTTYKLEDGMYRPILEALTTPGDPVTGAVRVLSKVPL